MANNIMSLPCGVHVLGLITAPVDYTRPLHLNVPVATEITQ